MELGPVNAVPSRLDGHARIVILALRASGLNGGENRGHAGSAVFASPR